MSFRIPFISDGNRLIVSLVFVFLNSLLFSIFYRPGARVSSFRSVPCFFPIVSLPRTFFWWSDELVNRAVGFSFPNLMPTWWFIIFKFTLSTCYLARGFIDILRLLHLRIPNLVSFLSLPIKPRHFCLPFGASKRCDLIINSIFTRAYSPLALVPLPPLAGRRY
jgi:hypothetical protein